MKQIIFIKILIGYDFTVKCLIFKDDDNGNAPKIIAPETETQNTIYVSEDI